jgi:HK97 family phage prohead protease
MRNPVMLLNHDRSLIAGQFTLLREDRRGLYVEGRVSDSPAEWMIHTRNLIYEGTLRTMSMGGYFYYGQDGRAIERVDLFEGSLVPIPSNPDAIFSRA